MLKFESSIIIHIQKIVIKIIISKILKKIAIYILVLEF